MDSGLWFPNGIAVQHTGDGRPKTLIVAETGPGALLAYDILGPGKLGPKRLWAKLPTENGKYTFYFTIIQYRPVERLTLG